MASMQATPAPFFAPRRAFKALTMIMFDVDSGMGRCKALSQRCTASAFMTMLLMPLISRENTAYFAKRLRVVDDILCGLIDACVP